MFCCVPGCGSDQKNAKYRSVSFHEIPVNLNRTKWLKAIARKDETKTSDWEPSDHSRVCSRHFKDTDYKEGKCRRYLKQDVCPSIFPNHPAYKQPDSNRKPKRRKLIRRRKQPSTSRQHNEIANQIGLLQERKPTTINVASEEILSVPETKPNISKTSIQEGRVVALKRNINKYRCRIYRLEKCLKKYQAKAQDMQTVIDNYKEVDGVAQVMLMNEAAKNGDGRAIFLLDLVKNFKRKKPLWSGKSLQFCTLWRMSSSKGYEFARKAGILKTPSRSTLQRLVGNSGGECSTGGLELVEQCLQAEELEPVETTIITDEICTKEEIVSE